MSKRGRNRKAAVKKVSYLKEKRKNAKEAGDKENTKENEEALMKRLRRKRCSIVFV